MQTFSILIEATEINPVDNQFGKDVRLLYCSSNAYLETKWKAKRVSDNRSDCLSVS